MKFFFVSSREAFTLLEIIVSLLILMLGMAALAHLTNLATHESRRAESLSQAQIAVQTRLNEMLASRTKIESSTGNSLTGQPDWTLDITVIPEPKAGLSRWVFEAKQHDSNGNTVERFELVRIVATEP